ncbi:hypothetical protein D0962_25325 [Leptolyngbyaceae cyanobacterium CCMR0082]|uniref:Uncharacterized protein n=1 Tax=Adonisia turfae CCMR0082 TaxID=2304604 RepID=A0A6M0SDC9_9CYAN|nr:hypothetical protein [Adonisia turfae]NEZ66043.1 hypothetical protein [Adonisia turfae CCMR0082]
MFTKSYYLLRSTHDGQYLAAKPRNTETSKGFLMLFNADYEALSYVNQHATEVANRFAVEPISGPQLKQMMERWGYEGVGVVNDPLVPQVEFLKRS